MISLIEALNYRCLRYVRQRLDRFHVLVGPNASGKTTFLDVVAFLSRFISDGPEAAVTERTSDFFDLTWQRDGPGFELAVEATIPEDRRKLLADEKYDTIRYELALAMNPELNQMDIAAERGYLKMQEAPQPRQQTLFPFRNEIPDSILEKKKTRDAKAVFSKTPGGNDNYYVHGKQNTYVPSFKLGPKKSTLGNLPEDELNHPVSTWLKEFLSEGVEQFILNSLVIRKASPPRQGAGFKPDGSNLPWVDAELERKAPDRFSE